MSLEREPSSSLLIHMDDMLHCHYSCMLLAMTIQSKQLLQSLNDILRVGLVEKMPSLNDADIGLWNITLERFSARWTEKGIRFPPNCYNLGLMLSQISLPFWICLDNILVILQKCNLYINCTGS